MTTAFASTISERVSPEESSALRSKLEYFRSRLGSIVLRDWLHKEAAAGRKPVGVLCWSVPAEIILACGGIPVRLSGVSGEGLKYRSELPRDICPLAASFYVEARALTREGLLSGVVFPGTCDWKRKLSGLLGKTKVLTLEAPSPGNARLIEADLKRSAREIALLTDLPLRTNNLRRASEKVSRASEACAALHRLRQHPGCAISGAEAFAVEQSFLRDDFSRWTEHCRTLVQFLKEQPPMSNQNSPKEAPRIMLVGSPVVWQERSLVHLVEEAGGKVVSEDFHSRLCLLYPGGGFPISAEADSLPCAGQPSHAPVAEARFDKDGPAGGVSWQTLARRWAETCFCSPIAEGNETLLFRAVEDFQVEGIVAHVYRSCARVQMGLPGILGRARARGIPSLILETQGDPNEEERLRARIEPFIEMLLARRRNAT